MPEPMRLSWVICPNCGYRYYVGAQLLSVEGYPAICPRCRHEFDANLNLESKVAKETSVAERL